MSRVDELREDFRGEFGDPNGRWDERLSLLIATARQEAHAQGFAEGAASERGRWEPAARYALGVLTWEHKYRANAWTKAISDLEKALGPSPTPSAPTKPCFRCMGTGQEPGLKGIGDCRECNGAGTFFHKAVPSESQIETRSGGVEGHASYVRKAVCESAATAVRNHTDKSEAGVESGPGLVSSPTSEAVKYATCEMCGRDVSAEAYSYYKEVGVWACPDCAPQQPAPCPACAHRYPHGICQEVCLSGARCLCKYIPGKAAVTSKLSLHVEPATTESCATCGGEGYEGARDGSGEPQSAWPCATCGGTGVETSGCQGCGTWDENACPDCAGGK